MASNDNNARACCSRSIGPRRQNFATADLDRLFKIFNDLDKMIKPIDDQKYAKQHKEYYIERKNERLRKTEEIGNVQKWTKGSKEFIVVLPNKVWVRDNNPSDKEPEPEMEPPMPFDIQDHLDRAVALNRIRELFKEMDEILYRKNSGADDEPTVPPPIQCRANDNPPKLKRYDSDNDLDEMSSMLDRTRML